MRVLVTGGAGFIGSHLAKRLVALGHSVVVLDDFRRGNKLDRDVIDAIELVEGDVRDEELVRRTTRRCDIVFHFAAVLGVDIVADNPVEAMETETFGLRNVVNASIANGVRKIVYASTSGVYGKTAIQDAVGEEFTVSPNSSYSIAKRYNEIFLKSLYQETGLQSVSLRFFNVYGPKQDTRMVIPRFIDQAIEGSPLSVFGTGEQTRDFTYIDDVVEATVRVAESVVGCEVINVARASECSIGDLAKLVVRLTSSKSEIAFLTPPSGRYDFEVERRVGDVSKLFSKIGFAPRTPLEEGLVSAIEHALLSRQAFSRAGSRVGSTLSLGAA